MSAPEKQRSPLRTRLTPVFGKKINILEEYMAAEKGGIVSSLSV